jgi:hypothetical protein
MSECREEQKSMLLRRKELSKRDYFCNRRLHLASNQHID